MSQECNKTRQPILVGTTSIEKSEKISQFLKEKNLKHNILNAKFHEEEAKIIASLAVAPHHQNEIRKVAERHPNLKILCHHMSGLKSYGNDKDKNLIGVAKVATPIRKTEEQQYTFKLKLDI